MIPVLFEATAKSFDTFGIGVLKDTISCEVTEERNGPFELVLKYPTSGFLYEYIKKERIVLAKPNDTKANQHYAERRRLSTRVRHALHEAGDHAWHQ